MASAVSYLMLVVLVVLVVDDVTKPSVVELYTEYINKRNDVRKI